MAVSPFKRAAFFDVDGTLVPFVTQALLVSEMRRRKYMRMRTLIFAGLWFLFYKRGLAKDSRKIRKAIYSDLKRHPKNVIDGLFSEVASKAAASLRPQMKAAVEEHRKRGDLLFAITGTLRELCAPLCVSLGITNLYAVDLVPGGENYTADWKGLIYEGQEKRKLIEKLAEDHGIDLSNSSAYADSFGDAAMLERVGFPVAVFPDPRLRRTAQKRGWKILETGGS